MQPTATTLRPLDPTDEADLRRLLTPAPAANLFQLARLREHGLSSTDAPDTLRSWGAYRSRGLVAEVTTYNNSLALYCPDPTDLPALVEQVLSLRPSVVSGIREQVEPLVTALGSTAVLGRDRCTLCAVGPDSELRFSLPNPNLPTPRLAVLSDIEMLVDFYQHNFYTLTQLPNRLLWRQRLLNQLLKRDTMIIVVKGQVVAAAQCSAETEDHAMIGGVATLNQQRGRGYAAACVAALCAHLLSKGVQRVCLFYLSSNEPAAALYRRLGFAPFGEWQICRLGL